MPDLVHLIPTIPVIKKVKSTRLVVAIPSELQSGKRYRVKTAFGYTNGYDALWI